MKQLIKRLLVGLAATASIVGVAAPAAFAWDGSSSYAYNYNGTYASRDPYYTRHDCYRDGRYVYYWDGYRYRPMTWYSSYHRSNYSSSYAYASAYSR